MQIAWGYIELGSTLTRAYVREDGAVCTAAGSVIDDIDGTELWKTRRAVDATMGKTDLRITPAHIALAGPSGAPTLAGAAILAATGLDGQIHTLESIIRKFQPEHVDALLALVSEFYGEIEAAA